MAGGFDSDDDEVIASINMVPFIDICLVLLIIFMVTSSYIVRAAIEVDLPTAASGSDVAPSTVLVEIQQDGSIFFNGEATSLDALSALVDAEVAAEETVNAIIAGDRRVDYGVVVDVVDVVKIAGVASFALNIDREPDE